MEKVDGRVGQEGLQGRPWAFGKCVLPISYSNVLSRQLLMLQVWYTHRSSTDGSLTYPRLPRPLRVHYHSLVADRGRQDLGFQSPDVRNLAGGALLQVSD